MDRYQFEDFISDYIENNLSMTQRKEVETYLKDHPEAIEKLDSVKNIMESMKTLPPVSASDDFMSNLNQRIQSEKESNAKPQYRRSFTGYTPLMAGLSAVVFIAFIMLGMEFMPDEHNSSTVTPAMAEEPFDLDKGNLPSQNRNQMFVETEEDSVEDDIDVPVKRNINDRIQLVGDKRP